uniref:Uncharacterized protein n=1 Tax=Kalanchoe fedtschenkoi TaxID=63787 RepID=A0A7N0UMT6_KALFE
MRNPSSSVTEKKSSGGRKMGLKRGPWTSEEDELLTKCINKEGEGKWRTLPERAGLARCGKSCRLRWMNYLRPCVKRGQIAPDEEDLILRLHRLLGNRWSLIAGRIPGRTDNEIKNYWNSHLSKKLISQGIDPKTHKPLVETSSTRAITKSLGAAKNGRRSESDNSGSSKMVTTTPPTSSGQNPNMYQHHFGSAVDGLEDDQMMTRGGHGNAAASDAQESAGCYYSAGQCCETNLHLEDGADAGGYHVNLQQSSQGLGNEDGIDCKGMLEDDGVFSSFLNSLINDDMFV